jgi:hypothetical protein
MSLLQVLSGPVIHFEYEFPSQHDVMRETASACFKPGLSAISCVTGCI